MSRDVETRTDRMTASLDLVRSLVYSWGSYHEGTTEQARAILNSGEALQALLTSAHDLLGHACAECGNDMPVQGQRWCADCLALNNERT